MIFKRNKRTFVYNTSFSIYRISNPRLTVSNNSCVEYAFNELACNVKLIKKELWVDFKRTNSFNLIFISFISNGIYLIIVDHHLSSVSNYATSNYIFIWLLRYVRCARLSVRSVIRVPLKRKKFLKWIWIRISNLPYIFQRWLF